MKDMQYLSRDAVFELIDEYTISTGKMPTVLRGSFNDLCALGTLTVVVDGYFVTPVGKVKLELDAKSPCLYVA
mgnify:CR=1 FL=1